MARGVYTRWAFFYVKSPRIILRPMSFRSTLLQIVLSNPFWLLIVWLLIKQPWRPWVASTVSRSRTLLLRSLAVVFALPVQLLGLRNVVARRLRGRHVTIPLPGSFKYSGEAASLILSRAPPPPSPLPVIPPPSDTRAAAAGDEATKYAQLALLAEQHLPAIQAAQRFAADLAEQHRELLPAVQGLAREVAEQCRELSPTVQAAQRYFADLAEQQRPTIQAAAQRIAADLAQQSRELAPIVANIQAMLPVLRLPG
jgi:hypothetical protein